jgi:hypothetical protein
LKNIYKEQKNSPVAVCRFTFCAGLFFINIPSNSFVSVFNNYSHNCSSVCASMGLKRSSAERPCSIGIT